MSREPLTIKLPKNMIITLQKICDTRKWDIEYLIEDALFTVYKEEITSDALEKYLGVDEIRK